MTDRAPDPSGRAVRFADRLHVRVGALATVVVLLTLLAVGLTTYRLVLAADRDGLDATLRQEAEAVGLGLPAQLDAAAGADGDVSAAEADLAVQRFLAVNPGSARHLTVVTLGTRSLSTREGPAELVALRDDGDLPPGEPGRVVTVDTDRGPVRVLTADVQGSDGVVGRVEVLGSLAPGREQAALTLSRGALAGGLGVLVGGVALLLLVRRALRPLRDLSGAARSVDLGGLDARVDEPSRRDEVGLLAHDFNRMLDRVQAESQHRDRTLSAVSHELRTPLAVARGHLELLEELGPDAGQDARTTAGVVRRELDRLARVVDDLSALSRGELDADVRRDPVFVPDVLDALRDRVTGLGTGAVTVQPGPPVVVTGDEDRLAQALLALVDNALTHGGADVRVVVSAEVVDDRCVLAVDDDGPGIDPAVRDDVFEPFVTTRPQGSGRTSGLGLAVVRSLTRAQGGTVEVRSGAEGTRVELALPLDA